ncbi:MAG: 3D domain-containing protein [Clostridia bacterium]|nr:3D domain-containing protein [Clostridia bacterium]
MLPARLSRRQRSLGLLVLVLIAAVSGLKAGVDLSAANEPGRTVAFYPDRKYVEKVLQASGAATPGKLSKAMPLGVGWVTDDFVKRTVLIPRSTQRISDPKLDRGMTRIVRNGRDGVMEQTLLLKVGQAGVLSESVVSQRVLERPEPTVMAVGARAPARVLVTSRGSYTYRKVLNMVATGYEPSERSCGKSADGYTAIGMKVRPGIVAVDPRVIPLRTRLYVEGYGPALAADVGGAIKGNRIDLFFETLQEALAFGRRRVKVYIVED